MTAGQGPRTAAVQIVPLCAYEAVAEKPTMVASTRAGRRIIVGVRDAEWRGERRGERLNAKQRGPIAADWMVLAADGTAIVDARMVIQTDDGALVYVSYGGGGDRREGPGGAARLRRHALRDGSASVPEVEHHPRSQQGLRRWDGHPVRRLRSQVTRQRAFASHTYTNRRKVSE